MSTVSEIVKRCISLGDEQEWFEYKTGTAVSSPDEVLAEIRREPEILTTQIADHLHLSRRQVEKTLDMLKNEDRLHHEGSARSGHWVINE